MNIATREATIPYRTLDRNENTELRSILFRHLDGFPVVATMIALKQNQVLDLFSGKATIYLDQIVKSTNGNDGYLQVAMRLMCSQGWFVQAVNPHNDTVKYTTTNRTAKALQMSSVYEGIAPYLPVAAAMDDYLFGDLAVGPDQELRHVLSRKQDSWGLVLTGDPDIDIIRKQILLHLEGLLVGPVLVSLGMRGLLNRYNENARIISAADFGGNASRMHDIMTLFAHMEWVIKSDNDWMMTAKGLFFLKRAAAYGVTVSYLPMFQKVGELLFGNPHVLWETDEGKHETHVDREMNVWGSGGAHSTYFSKIDEMIIEIFNRPIEEQPLGIADMGCGDGTFLSHIFDVIWEKTNRAKMLDNHPLFVIGSDYNQASIDVAKETLKKADIWANVIFGDIGDPEQYAKSLREQYNINVEDLLNVRSFLDHNRQYEAPEKIDAGRASRSTGAFSHRGKRITNNAIEQNLVDHFKKWAPLVQRFGLLVLELHTIPPKMAALNIGNTNVTAYDGTHGYSDQYILEQEVYLDAAREAGLHPDPRFQACYPDSDLATVTVNLLKGD